MGECCEDESDFCIGVCLQIFLFLLISTATYCYYAVVLPLWLTWGTTGIVNGVTFFILLFLMATSYLRTWLSDPGWVPSGWMPDDVLEQGGESGGVLERDAPMPAQTKDVRFCRKCDGYKPPRAQHCKQCGRCVQRMDHHCPWVQNCVGEANTKFFILFLFYGTVTSTFYAVSVVWFLWDFMSRKSHLKFRDIAGYMGLLLGTLIIIICLTLMLGSLFGWNVYLMMRNQTSLENYDIEVAPSRSRGKAKKGKHRYDMGTYKNLQSVLGMSPLIWLLPIAGSSWGREDSAAGKNEDENEHEMAALRTTSD
mmetsp:Transcript_2874/g.6633  ORF Transcript_2874/g.6633 Transcript_2874/m.6633 type:complete len:309 (-) Transcript_2874:123-1049(-)